MTHELQKLESPEEFLEGQIDCQKGKPAKQNASTDYMRGYSVQYQHEANQTAIMELCYE